MSNVEESDVAAKLVARIQSGERKAEDELVDRYHRGLMFILRRKCDQDAALAQDMAQDTWQVVISKIRNNQLREPSKLSAFIVQTGKNIVIAHFRKTENKASTSLNSDPSGSLKPQLIDHENSPEEFLQRYNLALLVKKLVLEMEQVRDKELLLRFFLHEQDKKVICKALSLDSVHFDRVLYRAKHRFRKLWDQYQNSS
ncbi:MAG: hypothetical protein Alis3KO_05280 [Aliiglaciecola sp.]